MKANKWLSLILAGIILASATACAADQTETDGTDTAVAGETESEAPAVTGRADVSDEVPAMDCKGEDFTIIGYGHTYSFMYAEELTGDVFNDALYNRNTGIAERFNLNLTITGTEQYDVISKEVKNSVQAGDDIYDLVSYHYVQMGNDLLADLYLNFRDVPYVNFSQPWWNSSTEELLTIDGRTFMAFGSLNLTTLSQAACIFYNMNMGEDYDQEDIFSLVMEGRWTIDKLIEMGSQVYKDTDGNGVRDNTDQYGFAFAAKGDMDGYLQAFGKMLVEKDENGKLTADRYYDEKLVSIMEKLHNLQSNSDFVWAENAWNVGFNLFIENTVLFGHGYIAMTQWGLRDSEIDYAIIPAPKWDEAQSRYYVTVGGSGDAQAVLRTAQNLEMIGAVTEALNADSWKYCEEAYYENTIKYKSTRAEENVEVLDMMMESRVYDFGYVYGGWESSGGGAGFWIHNVLNSGSADISSYYQSKKANWEKYLDSVFNKFATYEG
ncbi:MAG: hypothetical protein IKY52_10555 [Clostridia bacterium]|nr:hypothetical protein [Clostridia bacterium]